MSEPLIDTSIQRRAEAALESLEQERQQLREALHFWLKRVHVSSLSKYEQAKFSADYTLSRGE